MPRLNISFLGTFQVALVENYLLTGQTDKAKAQYLDALEWHLAIGRCGGVGKREGDGF